MAAQSSSQQQHHSGSDTIYQPLPLHNNNDNTITTIFVDDHEENGNYSINTRTDGDRLTERMPLNGSGEHLLASTLVVHHGEEEEEDGDEFGVNCDDNDETIQHSLSSVRNQTTSSSSSSSPLAAPTSGQPVYRSTRFYPAASASMDGVFSNLSAKPEMNMNRLSASKDTEDSLPAYESIAADTAPAYNVAVVLPAGHASAMDYGGTGDGMIIGGLPIGSMLTFIACFLTALGLQVLGFVICYGFGRTHAARSGAKAGLGLTLIREAVRLNNSLLSGDNDQNNGGSRIDILSFIIMVFGWFLFIHAISDYTRLRRIANAVQQQQHQQQHQQQQQTTGAEVV